MVSTHPHVLSNMSSIDVLAVNLSIQLLLILLETSKPLVTVRNVKATIQSSLQQQKELHQVLKCSKGYLYFETKHNSEV